MAKPSLNTDLSARFRLVAERLWWATLDLIFPPRCASCQQVGERLCGRCQTQIAYIAGKVCQYCGYPLKTNTPTSEKCLQCRRIPFQGQGLRSLALHTGPLRDTIHVLKYKRNSALAQSLAYLMAQHWPSDLPANAILTPVPLSSERQRERGFNQAELLARQLGHYQRLPVMTNILHRQKFTRTQVGLTARQRRQNVAGAFIPKAPLILNTPYILIDDVCTTGATLGACAEALLQSGVQQVWAYTLARAPLAEADYPN